jgi:hypothetical protein
MTLKRLIRSIPLFIVTGITFYTWFIFFTTTYIPNPRHYFTLLILCINIFFFFKNDKISTIVTGGLLLLALFNLVVYTVAVKSFWIHFGERFHSPPVNILSLSLLIIFFTLNFDFLNNWYLDYKESKEGS